MYITEKIPYWMPLLSEKHGKTFDDLIQYLSTDNQRNILRMYMQGMSTKEIAESLGVCKQRISQVVRESRAKIDRAIAHQEYKNWWDSLDIHKFPSGRTRNQLASMRLYMFSHIAQLTERELFNIGGKKTIQEIKDTLEKYGYSLGQPKDGSLFVATGSIKRSGKVSMRIIFPGDADWPGSKVDIDEEDRLECEDDEDVNAYL